MNCHKNPKNEGRYLQWLSTNISIILPEFNSYKQIPFPTQTYSQRIHIQAVKKLQKRLVSRCSAEVKSMELYDNEYRAY